MSPTATGAHLENLICTDLLAWPETESTRPVILYWRTSGGEEVDFVIEWQRGLLAVEVKATTNPGYNDSKGLRNFLQEYGNTVLGALLLHGGDSTFWIAAGVLAIPWWKIIQCLGTMMLTGQAAPRQRCDMLRHHAAVRSSAWCCMNTGLSAAGMLRKGSHCSGNTSCGPQ